GCRGLKRLYEAFCKQDSDCLAGCVCPMFSECG
nr:Chain B, E3.10 Disulfide constrained peptide [synthetic construct]